MENSLSRNISVAEAKVQYNTYVKQILAHKVILAWILKSTVPEYKDLSIDEIEHCIEGEPEISTLNVLRKNDKIMGSMTEDNIPGEGVIYYDIRFFAYIPGRQGVVKIILNVEAQKKFNPGYEIVTRGIFYGSRMISAQLGTEFEIPYYDDIKKVYSIWICMNAPHKIGNAISEYSITKKDYVSGIPDKKWSYDKMSIFLICLDENKGNGNELIRMLNTLLSPKKSVKDKKRELEENFKIHMTRKMEKEVNHMCNVADIIFEEAWDEGMEKGMEKGMQVGMEREIRAVISKMAKKGFSVVQISEILERPLEFVERVLTETEL